MTADTYLHERNKLGEREPENVSLSTYARALRLGLRERLLIRRRVGHGERETVDEFGVKTFPQPGCVTVALQLPGRLDHQALQRGQAQLRPGSTVIARVPAGNALGVGLRGRDATEVRSLAGASERSDSKLLQVSDYHRPLGRLQQHRQPHHPSGVRSERSRLSVPQAPPRITRFRSAKVNRSRIYSLGWNFSDSFCCGR